VELRSASELLVWLAEVSESGRAGALKRGDYLLDLAISERKVAHPPNPFGEWLYELRDSGLIVFDDRDAASLSGSGAKFPASNVFLLRGIGITAAGGASLGRR
jgi:hypothetical protein